MQSMIELLQSMRELIAGPKRRRGLKRFSGMCDGLEARQLMTAIVPGGFETEPNNSLGHHDEICVAVSGTAVSSRVNGAQSLVGLQHGAATLTHGSISAVDRQDWYKISVPTGGAITAELSGLTDDLDMEVRDSAGRIVGISNNGGAIGEKISLQTLSPGDYFVRIYGYGRSSSPWQLSTRVVPTDFLDVEPNNRRIHAASVGIINGQPAAAATAAAATLAQTPVPATPAARVIEGSLKADPVDWYQFQLSEEAVVTADLSSGSSGVAQLKSNRLTAGVYCLQVARDETGANFVLILTDSRARELTRIQKAANAEANYSIALNVLSESGTTAAQT